MTYYEDVSHFVGSLETWPEKPKDLFRYYPALPRCRVFWTIDGATGRAKIPKGLPILYAGWSPGLSKIVVPTLEGILLVSVDTGKIESAWEKPLIPRWALNDDLSRILVAYSSFNVEKRYVRFVAAIDLMTGAVKIHETPLPSGMVFLSSNVAVASVENDLLRFEYEQSRGWRFDVLPAEFPNGAVAAVMDEKPVWMTEADGKSEIIFEQNRVELPEYVLHVVPHEGEIWVLGRKGGIYRIDTGWKVHKMAEVDESQVIGSGHCSAGLWVVTDDGKVQTFGREKKSVTIDLPSVD